MPPSRHPILISIRQISGSISVRYKQKISQKHEIERKIQKLHLNIDMTHFSDFLAGLWFSTRQYWYKVVKISVCMRIFTLGDKISLSVTKFHSQWQKFISYLNYMYRDLLYTTYTDLLYKKNQPLNHFHVLIGIFFYF